MGWNHQPDEYFLWFIHTQIILSVSAIFWCETPPSNSQHKDDIPFLADRESLLL